LTKKNTLSKGIETIGWAMKFMWQEERHKFIGIVGLTFFRSLIPAGIALVGRELINTFVLILDAGTKDIHLLYPWILLSFILTILDALLNGLLTFWNNCMGDEIYQKLNSKALTHASQFNLEFFENADNQDLINHIQKNSLKQGHQLFTHSLSFISIFLQVLSLALILIYMEPLLTLILPFVVIPYYYSQRDLANENYQKIYDQRTKRRWTRYFVNLLTDFNKISEVKILNLSPLLLKKLNAVLRQFNRENRVIYFRSLYTSTAFVIASTIGIYLIFIRVAEKVIAGILTLGDVTIYTGTTLRLRTSLQNLIQSARKLKEYSNLVFDLKHFLELTPPTDLGNKNVSLKEGKPQAIIFENVSFYYPNSEKATLSNISFQIHPGEKLALVGINGAGKTTLVKLLARLYEPTSGRILYGKVSIKEFSKKEWQQQICFVFQNYISFEETVQENLAYGDWERLNQAANKQEQVQHIAQLTKIEQFIEQLPQGYQTRLGRKFGTHTLSIGEWQKIAIARAFARKDSNLLILDEPTASLDAQSEFRIFKQFKQFATNKSTILITHRFSNVSIADRILVLEKGRIIEQGSHTALLKQNGQYAKLYRLQYRDVFANRNS